MNKALSLGLLGAGIVLLIWGISASDSFFSSVSRFFTGSPTDKTIWLVIAGVALVVTGLAGALRRST